jgi:hypothetical protein
MASPIKKPSLDGSESIEALAKKIQKCGFSESSAKRRASCLMAWRKFAEAA